MDGAGWIGSSGVASLLFRAERRIKLLLLLLSRCRTGGLLQERRAGGGYTMKPAGPYAIGGDNEMQLLQEKRRRRQQMEMGGCGGNNTSSRVCFDFFTPPMARGVLFRCWPACRAVNSACFLHTLGRGWLAWQA